jgi:hypothetical protein
MYTLEVYARNQYELADITSFLQKNHVVYKNSSTPRLNEGRFFARYAKDEYHTPSSEFKVICGREHLNKQGQLRGSDMFTFLHQQLVNPNCFFLEGLMKTPEYLATQDLEKEYNT